MRFLIVSILFLGVPVCAFAQEVVRKTKVIRGEECLIDVFYKDGQEVGLQRRTADGEKEVEGNIPEGKVKFIDQTTGTYGEEYYKRGQKHGVSRTYFPTGELMKEVYYIKGILITEKEFFKNGQVRFEADYSRMCDSCKGGHEKGAGKIFYSDGKLKYEWNFNVEQDKGYQRAYTREGELRFEAYYDREGRRLDE